MTKRIKHRVASPDDPIYSTGIVFGGQRILPPKKETEMDETIDQLSREIIQAISETLEDDD